MTAVLDPALAPSESPAIHIYGQPRIFAGVAEQGRVDHRTHVALHREANLRRRSWLSAALRDINLLGRGGAAFPVGIKFDAIPDGARRSSGQRE